jgi:murein tripeptide amidase MpaA
MRRILFSLLFTYTLLLGQQNVNHEWITKFEESDYLSTNNYDESISYFQRIADHSEFAKLKTIGISPQGRELKCLIVSKDKIFDAAKAKKSKNAIILINNGIHAGEIEGKDASMLMLREILITGESSELIDNVILLIIPVFNIDGHERSSPYGRINQNGPSEMGWRTTAQNFNLNRDFTKADSPVMKAFLKLFNTWLPDILIDTHTTDGADFQYTITYAISKHQDIPPLSREIAINELIPQIEKDVNNSGFQISPFVGFIDGDYNNGIRDWIPNPRFSNGYAAAQNRIGILIETHMLKPYKDRVFSTKALLESVINYSNKNSKKLKMASLQADEYAIDYYLKEHAAFPLDYEPSKDSIDFLYKGFVKQLVNSKIAGKKIVKYTNEKTERIIPYYNKANIVDSVFIPNAYIIPQEWKDLIQIIKLHGIRVDQIVDAKTLSVEKYKFNNVSFDSTPYEGRLIPNFDYEILTDEIETIPGDYIVNSNQRSLGMIVHLLEPKAEDSFIKWGFMNIIFERKEYFEDYSMEPIAQQMYSESEALRNEFKNLVESDSVFANSVDERLNFFYERSPYYDEKHNFYPILRVVNAN